MSPTSESATTDPSAEPSATTFLARPVVFGLAPSTVLLLAAACGVIFFWNLGVPGLWDEDEPRNAQCAREMLQRGDWIVPTFNGALRIDKPILIYWVTIPLYAMFGVSELTARLGSAMWSTGTVFLIAILGVQFFRTQSAGLYAGLSLASSLMFATSSRAATTDATLSFWITAAFTCFMIGWLRKHRSLQANDVIAESLFAEVVRRRPSLGWLLSTYAALGVAVLAKGPSAVILPVAVIGLFTLLVTYRRNRSLDTAIQNPPVHPHASWKQRLNSIALGCSKHLFAAIRFWVSVLAIQRVAAVGWALRPMLCLLAVLLIAAPWYAAVGYATNGAWLAGFLGRHNVNRFLESHEGHSGLPIYYIVAILIGFAPWSLIMPAALTRTLNLVLDPNPGEPGQRIPSTASLFATCWIGVYVLFFTLASTKLPSYVLPCYPALALITGKWAADWFAAPQQFAAWQMRTALRLSMIAGMVLTMAMLIAASLLFQGDWILAAIGLIPIAAGVLGFAAMHYGKQRLVVPVFAGSAVVLAASILGFASTIVDEHQISRSFLSTARNYLKSNDENQAIEHPDGTRLVADGNRLAANRSHRSIADQPVPVATYNYFQSSIVFYAHQPVTDCPTPAAVAEFFRKHPDGFLITRDDSLPEIASVLPSNMQTLASKRLFLRLKHNAILMAQPPVFIPELANKRGESSPVAVQPASSIGKR